MLIPCWICYFQNNNCFSNIFEIESIVTSIGITQFQSIRVTEYILIKQGLKRSITLSLDGLISVTEYILIKQGLKLYSIDAFIEIAYCNRIYSN